MDPLYPDIIVPLSEEDGNIFFIIGRVSKAMRRAGISNEDITAFRERVRASHNYDEALQAVMATVNVS